MSNREEITNEEALAVNWVRAVRAYPKKEFRWRRQIGRLEVRFSWRSKKNLMGRFGGGWNWKLGFQSGGGTVIFGLLIAELVISVKKPEQSSR